MKAQDLVEGLVGRRVDKRAEYWEYLKVDLTEGSLEKNLVARMVDLMVGR